MNSCKTFFSIIFIATLAFSSRLGATIMEDIEFNANDNGAQVRVFFDSEPPTPGSYSISDPARIAIDLPNVINQLPQRKYDLDIAGALSLVAIEAGGRSRLVINLTQLPDYELYTEGNELVINLLDQQTNTSVGGRPESMVGAEPSEILLASSVTELDFKRGTLGEGSLLIKLTDPTVDVDVKKQGEHIFIKLLDTYISEDQRHVYDVVDFATAVLEFSAEQVGRDTLIKLLPEAASDYLAYQTDDVFVVNVAPLDSKVVNESGVAVGADAEFGGGRISLNFQDIEVRAVLQIIAEFAGLNLVASDNVQGSITLRLDNVPWDQALDIVLKTRGLAKRVNGNVMLVADAQEISEQERIELVASKVTKELLPLQTEFFEITYANAEDVMEVITTNESLDSVSSLDADRDKQTGMLSRRGSTSVDARTNTLIVTDISPKLAKIRELIVVLDVPVKQVMIEARIVSANDDFSRELGIRWGGASYDSDVVVSGSLEQTTDLSNQIASRAASFNSAVASGTSPAQAAASLDPLATSFPDAFFVDLGVGGAPSSLALSYLGDAFNVSAELSALESSGQGEVVSQPKVVTGDKQQANIKAGQQIGFQTATASGATAIEFKEAVLELDVTPTITPDNKILMDLIVTQDSISGFVSGENNSQIPVIDTTEVTTQVLINNGETIVLGGIFEQTDLKNVVKTPLLGDIPVVGRIFKRTVNTQVKRETLIFITPRIVNESLSN